MTETLDFDGFSGPEGQANRAEARLIEAAALGITAHCEDLPDEERVVASSLIVALATANFRHRDWPGWSLAVTGVRASGIRVCQALQLESRQIPADFLFQNCSFEAGIDLDNATLNGRLFLGDCAVAGGLTLVSAAIDREVEAPRTRFENPGGDAIVAVGASTGSWLLNEVVVNGRISLLETRISGRFSANNATFEGTDGEAVFAPWVVSSGWDLNGASLKGTLTLVSSKLDGAFSATQAIFDHPGETAVSAQGVTTSGWFMDEAIVRGSFDINGAQISGQFNANRSRFDNAGGLAIFAQKVMAESWSMIESAVAGQFSFYGSMISGPFIGRSMKLQNPGNDAFVGQELQTQSFSLDGSIVEGVFDLNHASIEGMFSAEQARFDNPGAVAVSAFSVRSYDWLMNDTVVNGGLDVSGGDFSGTFGGERASFQHPASLAIDARSARFQRGVYLRSATEVSGGADFTGAAVDLVLDFSDSVWRAARYRAIRLQEATIRGEVVLRNAVLYGHLHANRARVEGRVDFRKCVIVAGTIARSRAELPEGLGEPVNAADELRQNRFQDHAIVMQEVRIDGRLVMPEECPEGIVDLARARCDTLEDFASGWPAPLQPRAEVCETRICVPAADGTRSDIQHLVLDGFEYQHFELPSGRRGDTGKVAAARGNWLAGQSVEELRTHFNPQPWRQAAMVLRSMGHDEAAQDLSIQRRVRQRFSASTPWSKRTVSWLLHRVADYGFNPWKTVGISVFCVLLFSGLFSGLTHLCGGYGIWTDVAGACGDTPVMVAVQFGSVDPAVADRGYPPFHPLLYSLDIFVPILDLGSEGFWQANTRADASLGSILFPAGWILTILIIVERFLGAILIAIAITGFTGLLTRDEK